MSWRVRRNLLEALKDDPAFRTICERAWEVAKGDEQAATELVIGWVEASDQFRDRLEMIALHHTAADIAREMASETRMLEATG